MLPSSAQAFLCRCRRIWRRGANALLLGGCCGAWRFSLAQEVTIEEYASPINIAPVGITVGPDGALWFALSRPEGYIAA